MHFGFGIAVLGGEPASAARKRRAAELEESRRAAEESTAEMEALEAAAVQRSKLEADAAEAAAHHSRQLAAELDAFNKLPPLEQFAAWAHKLMGEVCGPHTCKHDRARACKHDDDRTCMQTRPWRARARARIHV